jgi:hypothetical protein
MEADLRVSTQLNVNNKKELNKDLNETAAHSFGFEDSSWRWDDMLIRRPQHRYQQRNVKKGTQDVNQSSSSNNLLMELSTRKGSIGDESSSNQTLKLPNFQHRSMPISPKNVITLSSSRRYLPFPVKVNESFAVKDSIPIFKKSNAAISEID